MYLYEIVSEGIRHEYDLTLSQLQGIYVYSRMIFHRLNPRIHMERVGSIAAIDPRGIDAYSRDIRYPLDYESGSSFGLVEYPPTSATKPYGLSIQLNQKELYHSIVTDNLSEFLSGFAWIDRIYTRSMSKWTFEIVSSEEEGSVILSSLTGFPFLSLPPDLQRVITKYYPCDWYQVNRNLRDLTSSRYLTDLRLPVAKARRMILDLMKRDLTQHERESIIYYIRSDTSQDFDNILFYGKLFDSIRNTIDYVIIDEIIERFAKISSVKAALQVFSFKSQYGGITYLLNNPKYSDIMYFDILDSHSEDTGDVIPLLTLEDLVIFKPIQFNIRSVHSEVLDEYVTDLFRRKGVYRKDRVNPRTRTRREDYQPLDVKIDINQFIRDFVSATRGQIPLSTLRIIIYNVDQITDNVTLMLLYRFILSSTPLLADVQLAKHLYTYLLRTVTILDEIRALRRGIRDGYRTYGYPAEFTDALLQVQ